MNAWHARVVRVLIVEDDVKMATLLRRGLREEGLASDVATRGEDALWMASSTEYDVAVLDMMLPGIDLSAKEFAMLEAFMRRPGSVLSRYQLLEQVWDYDYESRSNVVDVYVRYLREKVDRPFDVRAIETVRGIGYRLRKDGGRT